MLVSVAVVAVLLCGMHDCLPVGMVQYVSLYMPALDWILQCMAHGATEVRTCYQMAFELNELLDVL